MDVFHHSEKDDLADSRLASLNGIPCLRRGRGFVVMEEEGEAGSPRERVEVFSLGEGAYENANMQEDEKPSREHLVSQEDFSIKQQGAVGERLTEPEGSMSQVVQFPFSGSFLLNS